MSLKPLDDSLRSSLRSGVAISSISQCVEEVVHNSIDAGAQSVAVRIDIPKLFLQVVDNGTGISHDDLNLLGQRYTTSKCHTLKDLDDLRFHGYRGEAVASIINCCGIVEFASRHCLSPHAYCKIFHNGRSLGVCSSKTGYSNIGTTVTIQDMFYNLPVRRKGVNEDVEYEKVRRVLVAIALIHPNVSLSLRNNQNSEYLLQIRKCGSVLRSFNQLFGTQISLGLQEVSATHMGFKVSGYISTKAHYSKFYQFIYVNKRLMKQTRLHSHVGNLLSNSLIIRKPSKQISPRSPGIRQPEDIYRRISDLHGVFVLDIECSLCEYDICLEPAKTLIEFKRWDDALYAIELAVKDFLVRNNLNIGVSPPLEHSAPRCRSPIMRHQEEVTYGLQSRAVQRAPPPLVGPRTPSTSPPCESADNKDWQTSKVGCPQSHSNMSITAPTVATEGDDTKRKGLKTSSSIVIQEQLDIEGTFRPKTGSSLEEVKVNKEMVEKGDSPMADQECGEPCEKKKKRRLIGLDVPMRSPLHGRSIASKLSGLNSGSHQPVRTLLSAAKQFKGQTGNQTRNQQVTHETGLTESNLTGQETSQTMDHQIIHVAGQKLSEPIRHEKQTENNPTQHGEDGCKIGSVEEQGNVENQEHFVDTCTEFSLGTTGSIRPQTEDNGDKIPSQEVKPSEMQNVPPSGRAITTTYSFITPLSRDSHMVNNSHYLPADIHSLASQAAPTKYKGTTGMHSSPPIQSTNPVPSASLSSLIHGSHTVERLYNIVPISDPSNITSSGRTTYTLANEASFEDSGYLDCAASTDNRSTLETFDESGNSTLLEYNLSKGQLCTDVNTSIYTDTMELQDPCLDTLPSECIQKPKHPNPLVAQTEPESTGSNIGNTCSDKNSEEMAEGMHCPSTSDSVISNNDTSLWNQSYGHCPPRAASHLSYGFTPLKPRMREVRQEFKQSQKTVSLSELSFDVPESKWRGESKACVSSLLFDWKNPAFASGDNDVLDVGLSSESSSGIRVHSVIHPYKFTNETFRNMKVLGQIDDKFIACILQTKSKAATHGLLVLFDQHAVHERIRVEALIKGAYDSGHVLSVEVQPPQLICLSEYEKRLAVMYRNQLESVGIKLIHDADKVFVSSMPSAFCERDLSERKKGRSTVAMELVQEMVCRQLSLLHSTGGVSSTLPITLQQVLNSQACHGAVKFGDVLSVDECNQLIESLSHCDLPFQCAHGRPSLIPLLDLELLEKRFPVVKSNINIKKLKDFMTES